MDHALSVYLPLDRRHALATGSPLPDRTQGAALFADISGFTPLAEALARELGPRRGAEELPRQLNQVYDAVIQEVDRYGGSVIGFAGDAITCWFDGDTGLRATACGLAMQAAMRAFATIPLPSGSTTSLAMKVAVARGPVRRFLVGDPRVQLIDTLAGATLSRMAAAEQVAGKGEVVLDEATAQALGDALTLQSWRSDESGARFAVVSGLGTKVLPQPWPPLAPGTLSTDALRPWLLPTIYERLQAGQGEFLTELRPAVALFLRFAGIDYDSDSQAGHKLDQYIRWVQSLLVQYEGTLIQLTIGEKGSYLYAAFGAPLAHEDDARRAALTALALRSPPEALGFISGVQIALTRGTMRTGAYGGSTRRTYGVLGDEVNLAARLMQHAALGQIIASGRIQAATASLFTWQALPAIRVKGKSVPTTIFALLGQVRASTIHLTEPTYTLPMIGRTAELAALDEKMTLAQQRQGQVVGITAEAGMGKSRLVAEAIRHALARGFTGYGGECQSYGTNTPYLVWQPIWRAFFGLVASDGPERQAHQVARAIAELDESLLPRLPLLAPVLGLPLPENDLTRTLSPELRKGSREALLVDLLRARAQQLGAQQAAVLLVLEDCHWLDAASHDLLDVIGRAIWNLPVLVLLAYRPPEVERLELPRVSTLRYFTALPLTELSEQEAAELIAGRLAQESPHAGRQLPATLLSQLTRRAEGNPFYLEELLNYLHDQGLDPYEVETVEEFELPTSLHSLILSRIDRLSEAQKVTLKVASIIGRLFRLRWLLGYYPALGEADVVRRDLEALSRLDLTPLERPEPDLIYLFKHIVTREVAYESLPHETRTRLHEQLAAFLEQQGPERVDGYLDLLAYHYALSENEGKKRHYLRVAAEAAQASYANDAAQSYYQRLLPLLEDAGDQLAIHLRLGAVLQRVGKWESAEQHYQAALALVPTPGPSETQAQVAHALGKLHLTQGQCEQAHLWLTQALDQWERLDEPGGRSQSLIDLGATAFRRADYRGALDYLARGQAECQQQHDTRGLAEALNWLANISSTEGNQALAQAQYEASLALRREVEDKEGMARTLGNLGSVAYDLGNFVLAQSRYEEILSLSREMGWKLGIAWSLVNLGSVAWRRGNHAEAQARLEESLALFREMGNKFWSIEALSRLGQVAWSQGRLAAAQAQLEESLALSQEIGNKRGITWCLNSLGMVAWSQRDYATAQARLEESIAVSRQIGIQGMIVWGLNNLGAVAYRQKDLAGAWQHFRESLTILQTMQERLQALAAVLGAATLLSQEDSPAQLRRATRLLAIVARERAEMALALDPIFQALYEEAVAASRAALSEADFTAAWATGQTMPLGEAVALALAEEEPG